MKAKETIIYAVIICLLGGVIGYLIYPVLNKSEVPAIPKTPEIEEIGPVRPDTVFQIDPARARELRHAYLRIRDLQKKVNYMKDNPEIVIKEVDRDDSDDYMDMPLFESSKNFSFRDLGVDRQDSSFVYGTVWAYSPLPVEAFTASMTVRWSDFFDMNYRPAWEKKITTVRKTSTLKGLSAGIVATGAIAAAFVLDNPYIAIGGLAGGGFIILYF